MRHAVWIVVGWFLTTVIGAQAVLLAPAHVAPNAAVLVVTFLAQRRDPPALLFTAWVLGYLVGLAAGAPVGLHEFALVMTGLGVYVISGHLAGRGAVFFALIAGAATTGNHLVLLIATWLGLGHAGFSSWATAVLVFDSLATAVLAIMLYFPMEWLEGRLTESRAQGLQWR